MRAKTALGIEKNYSSLQELMAAEAGGNYYTLQTRLLVAELKALIHALNAYHIAAGGNGLVIDDWQIFCPAMDPEEVLS